MRGLPRLADVRGAISAGHVLPPVMVYEHQGRAFLVDGLHRYMVTKEMGFTHLPVFFCASEDFPIRPFTLADYE